MSSDAGTIGGEGLGPSAGEAEARFEAQVAVDAGCDGDRYDGDHRPAVEGTAGSARDHPCGTDSAQLFDGLLSQPHYLGYSYPIGANVRYLVRGRDGRVLACAVWSSAALKVASRDSWLGWSREQRMAGLCRLANNTRFCVLPWVRVPHLASHLQGLMVRPCARTGRSLPGTAWRWSRPSWTSIDSVGPATPHRTGWTWAAPSVGPAMIGHARSPRP